MRTNILLLVVLVASAWGKSDDASNEASHAVSAAQDKGKSSDKGDGPTRMIAMSAGFSPDGKRLVVGFYQKSGRRYKGPQIKMWEVGSRKEVNLFKWEIPPEKANAPKTTKEYRGVNFVSFLSDGIRLISVEQDSTCRIWNTNTVTIEREFGPAAGGVTSDGKRLLTLIKDGFAVYEVPVPKIRVQHELPADPIRGYSISPDGKRALFRFNRSGSTEDATFSLYWDLEKNKAIQHLTVNRKSPDPDRIVIVPFLFSPDGRSLLAYKEQGELAPTRQGVVLCEADGLKEIRTIRKMAPTTDVWQAEFAAFSPDGTKLLMIDNARKDGVFSGMQLLDLPKHKTEWAVPSRPEFHARDVIVFSPNGEIVFLAANQDLLLLDARNGAEIGKLQQPVFK